MEHTPLDPCLYGSQDIPGNASRSSRGAIRESFCNVSWGLLLMSQRERFAQKSWMRFMLGKTQAMATTQPSPQPRIPLLGFLCVGMSCRLGMKNWLQRLLLRMEALFSHGCPYGQPEWGFPSRMWGPILAVTENVAQMVISRHQFRLWVTCTTRGIILLSSYQLPASLWPDKGGNGIHC
jgi:hypothetical protein